RRRGRLVIHGGRTTGLARSVQHPGTRWRRHGADRAADVAALSVDLATFFLDRAAPAWLRRAGGITQHTGIPARLYPAVAAWPVAVARHYRGEPARRRHRRPPARPPQRHRTPARRQSGGHRALLL